MNRLLFAFTSLLLMLTACYKDKGNYDYNFPEAPVVSNLDSIYTAFVGDSLVIQPVITSKAANADFSLQWTIVIPEEFRDTTISAPYLRMQFGLGPNRYNTKLTITDNSNGMKYFRTFIIQGRTNFSTGITVLSLEAGKSQLSFIKNDGTIQPRIYSAIHGEDLPGGPKQVIPMSIEFITPLTTRSYWIICSDGNDPGVQIEANTMKRIKTLRQNFFDVPATAKTGYLEGSSAGVLQGVVNGKLYVGTSQTFYGSDVYGMFGHPAQGDYVLYEKAAFNAVMPYFLGYEKNRKQVVGFTNFGTAAYIGTSYALTDATAFNPMDMGLDLVHFQQINSNNTYAFGRDAGGTLYECMFTPRFMGFIQIQPMYKRAFARPELITASTQWAGVASELFYFTSGDTIYRYNPLNQEIKQLVTDFKGKAVTMIKAVDNGNTLLAGVEGSLYFLDIGTGKLGEIIKKYDGIPGAPVDATIRTQ